MFALAAFRRALPLKLACSFSPLHSHALMRALAFTLHLSSPLSPTHMDSSRVASFVHGCSPTLFSSFLLLRLSYCPSSLTLFFTFQSRPSYLLYLFTLSPPCISLHLSSLPPSLYSSSSSSYLLFHSVFPVLSSPTTCLCSTPVRQQHYVGHSVKSALGAAVEPQNE